MKRRQLEPEIDSARAQQSLCEALLSLRTTTEVDAFLDDLCTPAEREAMRDRWSVVPHLVAGEPYWQIHEATAVSITTIGRVARCLEQGAGGYALAASRMSAKSRSVKSAGTRSARERSNSRTSSSTSSGKTKSVVRKRTGSPIARSPATRTQAGKPA